MSGKLKNNVLVLFPSCCISDLILAGALAHLNAVVVVVVVLQVVVVVE